MSKTKMLLMMPTLLTTIILFAQAAEIKQITVEPVSSDTHTTGARDSHHAEETAAAAAAAEEHEGEKHDAEASLEKEHDDTKSDHHEEQHHNHWNYHGDSGPKSWSSMDKECSGRYQSPINIDLKSTKLNELLTEISLLAHNRSGDKITVSNNGHTVSVTYDRTTIRLKGGGYDHTYRVAGVHFHWGSDDLEGSEHMIDGKHFPLEMHVVSYDEDDFNSVGEATSSRDGIAVLGVLFTVSKDDNINFDPLISHLKDVRDPDEPVSLEYFDLRKLLPLNRKNYFRYSGSLTTPPCSESVLWTVFETPQTISSTQLAEFRTLFETVNGDGTGDHLLYNWRPVQPTLVRVVYRSFPTATAVSHLSPVDAQSVHTDDYHQDHNAATSVGWSNLCQRNIFIGWMTFYLIVTML